MKLTNHSIIPNALPTWELIAQSVKTNDKANGEQIILEITKGNTTVLHMKVNKDLLTVSLLYDAKKEPITLSGHIKHESGIRIRNTACSVSLYIDDILQDEDWPIGQVDFENARCNISVYDMTITDELKNEPSFDGDIVKTFSGAQGWRPEGSNTNLGDCMPFYFDGTYHLYYLFDRRGHKSKWGLGAHQWAHISTNDFVHWSEHPMAIKITKQAEGSICTGSLLHHEGTFYAFYSVRMADSSPAQLTWATSKDGIHFEKSGKVFCLTAPYHPASARDPKVFKDKNGLFHMLITTSFIDGDNARGCLAHAVSNDLLHWEQGSPFIAGLPEQPECSDYFYKNGYYYLIFSNNGTASYYISKEPLGPWTEPENNIIQDEHFRVPKMAFWENDRIIFAGFKERSGYGGTLAFYEALQNEDGTLEFILPEDIK